MEIKKMRKIFIGRSVNNTDTIVTDDNIIYDYFMGNNEDENQLFFEVFKFDDTYAIYTITVEDKNYWLCFKGADFKNLYLAESTGDNTQLQNMHKLELREMTYDMEYLTEFFTRYRMDKTIDKVFNDNPNTETYVVRYPIPSNFMDNEHREAIKGGDSIVLTAPNKRNKISTKGSALDKCKSALIQFLDSDREQNSEVIYVPANVLIQDACYQSKFVDTIFIAENIHDHKYYFLPSEKRVIKKSVFHPDVLYDYTIDELELDQEHLSMLDDVYKRIKPEGSIM